MSGKDAFLLRRFPTQKEIEQTIREGRRLRSETIEVLVGRIARGLLSLARRWATAGPRIAAASPFRRRAHAR